MTDRDSAIDRLVGTRRLRPIEALPWVIAIAAYFLLPQYLQLGTQILYTILYALSLDLLLGYTGIVTLGHAAYFGTGAYTAGLLAVAGWHEPITGLLLAMAVARPSQRRGDPAHAGPRTAHARHGGDVVAV